MKKDDIYIIVGLLGILETILFIGFCFLMMSVSSLTAGYYGLDHHIVVPIVLSFIGFGFMVVYGILKRIYGDLRNFKKKFW